MKTTFLTLNTLLLVLLLASCGNPSESSQKDSEIEEEIVEELPEVISDSEENEANFRIGQFTYFADAAVFLDCTSDERFNVASEADIYKEQEMFMSLLDLYKTTAKEPGMPIYVEIQGYYVPKEEGEEGWDFTLVPNKFNPITKEESQCK